MNARLILSVMPLFYLSFSAQNLVPDPSFEDYTSPYCGITSSLGLFNQTLNEWNSPTQATPQMYFTDIDPSCYNYQPESQYDGPIGIKGDQLPRTGTAMCGLWLYTIEGLDQRHYVQAQLEEPMQPGVDYEVEFYVSLGDYMEKYTDRIGAYLSLDPVSLLSDSVLAYSPQVMSNDFVDDIVEWTRVIDTIQVTEPCQYITIGNFFADTETTTLDNPSASGAVSTYGAFYFLDDVRVELVNPVGLDELSSSTYNLYPNLVFDILHIDLALEAEVEIYDVHGRLVHSSSEGIGTQSIDLSSLSQGQYVVLLNQANDVRSSRIMKR